MIKVYFKKLDPRAIIPEYMTPHSAGMDLSVILDKELWIPNGEVRLLQTGLAIEMPHNLEAQIRPRSGLSLRHPNYIANSPGTIDADYRGEIRIPFVNNASQFAIIHNGDRIAQIIFSRVAHIDINEIDELSNTIRNTGGFGHTGL